MKTKKKKIQYRTQPMCAYTSLQIGESSNTMYAEHYYDNAKQIKKVLHTT